VTSRQPILALERVSKNFAGLRVVEDLSFAVSRNSCTALIGPNGAGKTTVFNLITGAHSIDAGRMLLDGRDIGAMPSRDRIRHGIARNFQNIRLMPHLTALENIMVGQHCRNGGLRGMLQPVSLIPRNRWREEARSALAEAGLSLYERATVKSLPYGVQKRIELVRALIAHPRLLLLDEPAAGLNSAETELLREQLASLNARRGITILVVEHDMHFVGALCARVIVLNFGRKIAEGTADEIREHAAVQEAYFGLQSTAGQTRSHVP
jgi:branched-chain amino acid transport system ATP-binding protein